MKEISEEMQMLIFDLLENNLGEIESKKAMNLIDSNVDLKHEFELLKQTYLLPENNVVFADKNSLYKSEKPALLIGFSNIIKYAAVAIVLVVFGIGFYIVNNRQNSVVSNTQNVEKNNANNLKNNTNKNVENVAESNNNHVKFNVVNNSKLVKRTGEKNNKIEILPKVELPIKIDSTPAMAIVKTIIPSKGIPIVSADETEDLEPIEVVIYQEPTNNYVPLNKRRSLGYKLLNSTRALLAGNGKAKIITEKNGTLIPKIQLEIKKPNTIPVMATLYE